MTLEKLIDDPPRAVVVASALHALLDIGERDVELVWLYRENN